MRREIIALASVLPPGGVPSEIVYIPEGENLIYPKSHPQGILVKMPADRGQQVAASFQTELDKLASGNIRPRLDFKHEAEGPTSGYPKSFRYQPGKGLMCSVDWSGAGKNALEGRDFAYFSPRFDLGDDGIPEGLPSRGPLGALVNEPAFREIERIAAAAAPNADHPTMSVLILATCGLLTEAEAAKPDAESIASKRVAAMKADGSELVTASDRLKALEDENKALKEKVTASEAAKKTEAETRATEMISAAIADGRILAADKEKQDGFRERIIAGDAFSIQLLKDLPKVHEGIEKPIVEAGAADRPVVTADKFKDLKGGDLLEAALAAEAPAVKK